MTKASRKITYSRSSRNRFLDLARNLDIIYLVQAQRHTIPGPCCRPWALFALYKRGMPLTYSGRKNGIVSKITTSQKQAWLQRSSCIKESSIRNGGNQTPSQLYVTPFLFSLSDICHIWLQKIREKSLARISRYTIRRYHLTWQSKAVRLFVHSHV